MATEVIFKAGSNEHVLRLGSSDESILSELKDVGFVAMMGWSRSGRQQNSREEVLRVAKRALEQLRQDWSLLPYRYGFECCIGGDPRLRSGGGGGGASGFHIQGRVYCIHAGIGRCDVRESGIAQQDNSAPVFPPDVRGQKVIQTDDWGPIRIRRRRLDSQLPDRLSELVAFLGHVPALIVSVATSDGHLPTMQLVRMVAEGNEGAEEELFNRDTAARDELIAKGLDRKARKHHVTIAWILLTSFPSPESRRAVDEMLKRETDLERQVQLAAVLTAVPEAAARRPAPE